VRTVRLEVVAGGLATPVLPTTLSLTNGLSIAGWIIGLAVGWTATTLLAVGRVRSDKPAIQPADWVTLVRALLVAGVAALVADSFVRPAHVTTLVVLAAVAIALDAVDGQVARRTGTATALGARFDGEVDAFLILVLSVAVSRDLGGWVIAIGAMRYAFLVAGWLVPWMAAQLPPRYWGKVVAAVQAIVLTVVASGVVPRMVGSLAVGVALVLLIESFGHNVVWLYRTGAEHGGRERAIEVNLSATAPSDVSHGR
jgi:phosphatidylglycerophosphate synthase